MHVWNSSTDGLYKLLKGDKWKFVTWAWTSIVSPCTPLFWKCIWIMWFNTFQQWCFEFCFFLKHCYLFHTLSKWKTLQFQDVHIFNILNKNWLLNMTKYNWNSQFPTFYQWCLEDLFSLIIIIFLKLSPNEKKIKIILYVFQDFHTYKFYKKRKIE